MTPAAFGSAKLREFVRGKLKRKENEDLYPHVGVVRPGCSTSELLWFMESVYDPDHGDLPTEFKDTRAARILRRRAATE